MQRLLVPALASLVIGLAPHLAAAQNTGPNRNYNQNGATAWGDPWMNENDFDYNRRHWLPPDNSGRNQGYNNQNWNQNQDGYGQNNWSNGQGYNQNWNGNQGYQGQYQNNYGPSQGNYGQNGRYWNGQGYDNRYGSAYPGSNNYPRNNNYQGSYNGQPGYGRNAPPYAAPGYDDEE